MRCFSGTQASLVTRSTIAANRCEKVPRRESWPARRTGRRSISSEPMAIISAVAQSIGPSRMACARRSSCGMTLGCTTNPSGNCVCTLAMVLSMSCVISVRRASGLVG